jgi:uncharacterized protein (DUF58 family)
MRVLRNVGYIIVAVAVLTALLCGAFLVAFLGVLFGILLKLIVATLFTATAIKSYVEDTNKRK